MRCRSVQCIYGTVTGKAQSIAEQIYNEIQTKEIKVDLYSFEEFGKSWNLEDLDLVIIVSSTTGDGEQPEAVTKFWRKLRPRNLSQQFLSHVSFTILGLGDTNYNQFCNAPKKLRNRLKELGSAEIYPAGWADDGTGLEIVVEPWLDGLYPALTNFLKSDLCQPICDTSTNYQLDNSLCDSATIKSPKETKMSFPTLDNLSLQEVATLTHSPVLASCTNLDLPKCPIRFLDIQFTDERPPSPTSYQNGCKLPFSVGDVCTARVISNANLTSPDAVKTYMEMTLDTGNSFSYVPGDSFGVICKNSAEDVEFLIKHMNLQNLVGKMCKVQVLSGTTKAKAKVPDFIPQTGSIEDILKTCLDIRSVPKKLFLRSLVEYTTISTEKRRLEELCSKQGSSEYTAMILQKNISVLDLMKHFPSCVPPISLLLEHLPRLLPRPYSASTSPLAASPSFSATNGTSDSRELGFVYTVVEEPRPGLCTGWLRDLSAGDTVQVYPRAATLFTAPLGDARFIMVCAGSGIGPFLGFLEHRKQLGTKTGFSWLVFGCRHKGKDDLHVDRLRKYVEDGYLSKLSIAYSREEDNGGIKYVQDVLESEPSSIRQLLAEQDGSVYVCGDAKNMGKSVYDAFTKIMSTENEADGIEFMKNMVLQKKYLQDLWS